MSIFLKYFPLECLRGEVDALFSICMFFFLGNIALNERRGTVYVFLFFLLLVFFE